MSDEPAAQNWWSTLPGMLTASATAITAIGGLITVLIQAGLLHGAPSPSAPIAPPAVTTTTAATTPTTAPKTANADAVTDASASTVTTAQTKPSPEPAPVAQAAPTLSKGDVGSNMADFAGSWQNANPSADGILKIEIRNADATLYVRAWAKCRPTDCDWGEVQAEAIGNNVGAQAGRGGRVVTAEFKNNVRQVVLTIHPAPNHRLRVEAQTHFVDQSGRAPIDRTFMFESM